MQQIRAGIGDVANAAAVAHLHPIDADAPTVRATPAPTSGPAVPQHRPSTIVHGGEIASRGFRTSFRGYDPVEVREWLRLVEASHEALEDELDRLRAGWDELLLAAARTRAAVANGAPDQASRWHALAAAFEASRPDPALESSTTGYARAILDEAMRGRRDAQAALLDVVGQLARLQHENAVLRAENQTLRSRLIETLTGIGAS